MDHEIYSDVQKFSIICTMCLQKMPLCFLDWLKHGGIFLDTLYYMNLYNRNDDGKLL